MNIAGKENIMKIEDVNRFIEEMRKIGDEWTEEQVMDVYKNKTFEEALEERTSQVDIFLNTIVTAVLKRK